MTWTPEKRDGIVSISEHDDLKGEVYKDRYGSNKAFDFMFNSSLVSLKRNQKKQRFGISHTPCQQERQCF